MDGKELEDALTKNKVIAFNNKICCTKKSYFFGYVYPKIMKENKKHKSIYNQICFQKFGCDIKSLEFREDKTEDQKKLLYQYRKYMPLMENKSIMNILSKYIEGIEFDNKWSKPEKEFDWKILLSGKYEIINNNMIKKISNIIKDFNKTQKILSINLSYMNDSYNDEEKDDDNIFKYLFNVYENELLSVCSNTEKLCDYVVYVYYNFYKNHSKSLLWNVFGNEIVNVIKSKSDKISYPVKDDSGQLYLGEKFKLKEIDIIK